MTTHQKSCASLSLDLQQTEMVRTELEAILRSRSFRRCERHSRFLRFVCEATLNGEGPALNEHLIAHRVFDRGDDYSPGEDSVVRRQAYSVRQKLQEYYKEEGRHATLRIELPVGRYVPSFQFQEQSTPVVEPEEPVKEQFANPAPSTLRRSVAIAICLLLLGIAIGWFAGARKPRAAAPDPMVAQIWGPWLALSDPAVICFSNALTGGIRRTDQPFPEDNPTRGIPLLEQQAEQIRSRFHLPAGGYFYLNPALAHAKMGEALGSIALTTMFTRAGVPVRATQSRYLSWPDFRNQNMILLGHDEANQWLDPILSKLPFRLARTTTDKPRRIIIADRHPGERIEYYADYSKGLDPPAEDYALVSFVRGFDGHHGLALLNGVNTEGTLMAIEYLTDPVSLRSLEAQLRKAAPGHSGIWRFQAILHSELRDGVPTGIELLALRVLP